MPQRMAKSLGRRLALCALALWAALLWGCAHGSLEGEGEVTLFQVSTIDALMEGAFQGQVSVGRLARQGDLGIGTFHALDGEMVILEGRVYQVRADGKVRLADPDLTTPFANVVRFRPQRVIQLQGEMSLDELCRALDQALPSPNLLYAVRLDGAFAYLKARSVPAQERPYPKLVEVVKRQSVFEFRQVQGTVLGFRCPEFVKGVNVPGWHLHFLDQTRNAGGHVLELRIKDPRVEVVTVNRFVMVLPTGGEFMHSDLVTDKAADLHTVEKGR
ncbi:MAG: acetolactate decarboxylase [Desulfarculus sp.]|nr:acetolactate decarboxylase [Desulfarculus sp.]